MQRRYDSRSYYPYDEPISMAIRVGGILSLIGFLVLMAGPIGYRIGLLSLPVALNRVFVGGAYLAGIGLVFSVAGLVSTWRRPRGHSRGVGRAVLAIAVGALTLRAGGRIPFITPPPTLSDISTDTLDPPDYVALREARGEAASIAYPGGALAVRQREAYPDIQPLTLSISKDEAFAKALGTVRDLGWKLVAADGPAGRIEASASTRLFGTVDDVVVRVSEVTGGSRVDVRAASRDESGGANPSRVRAILQALQPS